MAQNLDESLNKLWRLFLMTHITVVEQIEQDLAAANLPPLAWYSVLWALERAPNYEMRLHELAEQVLLSRSNITRLIDRLEEAGLLSRRRCPLDRRGAYAVLTAEGLVMRQKIWAVYSQAIANYFATDVSEAEVNTLTTVFEKILTRMEKISDPAAKVSA